MSTEKISINLEQRFEQPQSYFVHGSLDFEGVQFQIGGYYYRTRLPAYVGLCWKLEPRCRELLQNELLFTVAPNPSSCCLSKCKAVRWVKHLVQHSLIVSVNLFWGATFYTQKLFVQSPQGNFTWGAPTAGDCNSPIRDGIWTSEHSQHRLLSLWTCFPDCWKADSQWVTSRISRDRAVMLEKP